MNTVKSNCLPISKVLLFSFLSLMSIFSVNSSYAGLSQSPLFLTVSIDPNVLFNMSIESPMGGAAYNDQPDGNGCAGRINEDGAVGICYSKENTYLGYFDPDKCYLYNSTGKRFEPDGNTINNVHECTAQYSGNFMNWATMTAMDMFTWTMTGGNRIVDSADNTTVVRRMRKQNNDDWFPYKLITAAKNVAPSTVTPWSDSKIFIYNTDFGVKFSAARSGNEKGVMNVDIKVCDKNKSLESNCVAYGAGAYYKPEGLVQKNADHIRFGITSYTNTDGNGIDGGVLRSNIKYVGALKPNGSGGVVDNPNKEIKADGTLELNSNPGDATSSGVTKSGVIPYINKFSDVSYKANDPASELFYESIRYFKNLGPTPEYLKGENGGFPILKADRWQDPMLASCQKNFIVGINDANPWMDKKLPGSFFTAATFNARNISQDYGQPSNADSAINVKSLTNKVGDLEGLTNTSQCIGCTSANCDMLASNKNIPGLGEVFGTCPYTGKDNAYYIAGLAYYANTQDLRTGTGFDGEQTVNTFMVDTQEYNAAPLVGKMNMLWLAGKYGGFNDFNHNDIPDNKVVDATGKVTAPSEWDADGNNEPDNYVLATNPKKLIDALNQAFIKINAQSSSASAVAVNTTRLDTGTQVYQAKFNTEDWRGELQAFNVDINTGGITPAWEASTKFPSPGNRKLYTFNPLAVGGARGVVFKWDSLTTDQKNYLNESNKGSLRVDWLRGDDTGEQKKPGGAFRNRTGILGDIVNSDPVYVKNEDYGYADLSGVEGSRYKDFRVSSTYSNRRPMIYVGANDGMLHGFDANKAGGNEMLAYIPNALFPELSKLVSPLYTHQYYVDGATSVGDVYDGTQWHTLLVGSTGAGGRAVFALDVTNPDTFGSSNVWWEFTNTDDADLGYTLAQPSVVRMQDGHWVVVVGNGYNSDNGHAVLFVLDALTGAILKKLDTGAGTATNKNGLSSPIALDTNNDHSVDTVYAGDLYGNLWKFDVSGNISSWTIVDNKPFFIACTTSGTVCNAANRQPITSKLNVGKVGASQNGMGIMLYFGTGKYVEIGDNVVSGSPQVQTFYGLWDKGSAITDRNMLQAQTIDYEGSATTVKGVASNKPVRVVSKKPVCYAATSSGCTATSTLKMGWSLNLLKPGNIAEGERAVSFPLVRRGLVVFSTVIPNADACSSGGKSRLMEVDALTGGEFSAAAFDVNGDGKVDGSDKITVAGVEHFAAGIDVGVGIIKTPAIIEAQAAQVDFKYVSGSTGNMGTVLDLGGGGTAAGAGIRRSWRQLK
ncbi:pilus assembly protein [Crenothrix sp.]|uniref:pilus assembly protein n=1 Tax=Crenothrix sp. TaxID=3100433 RepID=UPI00374C92C6